MFQNIVVLSEECFPSSMQTVPRASPRFQRTDCPAHCHRCGTLAIFGRRCLYEQQPIVEAQHVSPRATIPAGRGVRRRANLLAARAKLRVVERREGRPERWRVGASGTSWEDVGTHQLQARSGNPSSTPCELHQCLVKTQPPVCWSALCVDESHACVICFRKSAYDFDESARL